MNARLRRMGMQLERVRDRCINGHNKAVTGVYSNGGCRLCAQVRAMHARGDLLPTRRLLPLIGDRESAALALAGRFGYSIRTAQTYCGNLFRGSRISIAHADEWCIALGTSLSVVYPEVYHAEVIEWVEDEEVIAS